MDETSLSAEDLGGRIREAYQRCGMRRADFVRAVGVSYPTVLNWEKGATQPNEANLAMVAQVTGFSVDELLGLDVSPAFERFVSLYARSDELREAGLLEQLRTMRFRGGPPSDPAVYVSIAEHLLGRKMVG